MNDNHDLEFDLNGALDSLAARVCREIKSKHRRERAIKEFRGHLEDAAEDIMRQGNPPEKAYAELEESLGDTDKLSTLLASVHYTHHVPVILPWLAGAAVLAGLIYLYLTTENYSLQSWIGVGLQLFAIAAGIALVLFAAKWTRAIGKRASALRRLQKYVNANGGTLIRRGNCYKSLFVRTAYPELTVDIGDRRYILSLWATVKRRRTLHLQDNGIYSYDKHFGYILAAPGIAPWSRVSFFRPKGMENDPLFTWYHSEMMRLPEGAHLMPEVDTVPATLPIRSTFPCSCSIPSRWMWRYARTATFTSWWMGISYRVRWAEQRCTPCRVLFRPLIEQYYSFSEFEKQVFPILFRYMNSFWWFHLDEIELIKEDEHKIVKLFDWLEHQMTRDDIRLP